MLKVLSAKSFGSGLLTAILSLTLSISYLMLLRHKGQRILPTSLALTMLSGIYLLGPLFMFLGQTFRGAGFHEVRGLRDWFLMALFSLIPPYTLMMSVYDTTLFALLFATVFLICGHFALERSRGKNSSPEASNRSES